MGGADRVRVGLRRGVSFGGVALLTLLVGVALRPAAASGGAREQLPRRLHTYAQQLGRRDARQGSSTVTLGLPYSWWSWPDADPSYDELSQPLTIEPTTTRGAPYFWAHQFHSQYGEGGFVGLQDASYPSNDKIALFSVWSADGAQGTTCGTFSGEGNGWSCRIDPYPWVADRRYIVSVRIETSSTPGAWFVATVTDTKTGAVRPIGRIHVPAGWVKLQGWVSWTEYFGPPRTSCRAFPVARARFDFPTANSGAVSATGDAHVIGTGDCKSQVKDYRGGDRQIAPATGP